MSKHRVGNGNALRASNVAVLRASTARPHQRSFWNGRHRWDWASQLDPTYQRYARIRTLKTRAKLLKNIRRRGAFEWDVGTKPFFTPRHLRWASHWRGRQWYNNDDPNEQVKDEAAKEEEKRAEEDGYELSRREKEWKEQMEAMRKRIQQDPYEAIFGKRFEPFWSPLVPSWMREEMGLQGWPKEKVKEAERVTRAAARAKDQTEPDFEKLSTEMNKTFGKPKEETSASPGQITTSGQSDGTAEPAASYPKQAAEMTKPFSRMTRPERIRHVYENAVKQHSIEQARQQPESGSKSYAYASSTSWDSASNKTRKTEWDSESNRTKKFEYDPISNRMVEIEVPEKVAIDSDSSAVRQSVAGAKDEPSRTTKRSTESPGMLVRQSNEVRKSIPIPPPLSQPSHSVTLGYTQTSVGPPASTAVSSTSTKPAALAKLPATDLDMLTADNVRASMGKVKDHSEVAKGSTAEEKAELERAFDSQARSSDAEVDAILKERSAKKDIDNMPSSWDRAETIDMFEREVQNLQKKKERLVRDEKGLFHIEGQKRRLQELDDKIKDTVKKVEALNLAVEQSEPSPLRETRIRQIEFQKRALQTLGDLTKNVTKRMEAIKPAVEQLKSSPLQTSLQRAEAKKDSPLLQSSIERMQSRDLPKAHEQDLDDAAAHESTEPINASTVPKEWSKQADLLQADRVKRTAAKRPYPMTRWIDDMNARKVAYEHRKAEAKAAEDAKNAESNARLEKINKMLQSEVDEQKSRMQAFEGKYAQKVRSLRTELDTAFKQSTVHSEKHVERIRELEDQLSGLQEKESKYADKVKSLRDELERAYKQSAVHAEKHLERIKYLEGELENATKSPSEAAKQTPQALPAEGDLCLNAPSFADNGKWYKKPANTSGSLLGDIEKATERAQDDLLVERVQDIYEKEYGVIDENHEQPSVEAGEAAAADKKTSDTPKPKFRPNSRGKQQLSHSPPFQRRTKSERKEERKALRAEAAAQAKAEREAAARGVVEVESDVDLGEELAKYEKENPEAYNVAQAIATPENSDKMKAVIADSLEKDLSLTKAASIDGTSRGVQWAEPPLYKVLAYDSGNDMMSTATTTTSVLPGSEAERPLGIPEALGRLYQPARFVPYFADLQSDNFQAIAATREVIVFRKVKANAEPEKQTEGNNKVGLEDHGLAGLKAGLDESLSKGSSKQKREQRDANSNVNPIDGTSRREFQPATGNFASPTGFVNHDPVFPPEPKQEESSTSEKDVDPEVRSDTYNTIAKEPTAKTSRQIWESLPGSSETPVKRTEPVFSGMTKKQRKRMEREQEQQRQQEERERQQQSYNQRQWKYEQASHPDEVSGKRGGKALKYMLGAGLSTATVMYLVGALIEKQRRPDVQAEKRLNELARAWEAEKRKAAMDAERLAKEWERR